MLELIIEIKILNDEVKLLEQENEYILSWLTEDTEEIEEEERFSPRNREVFIFKATKCRCFNHNH